MDGPYLNKCYDTLYKIPSKRTCALQYNRRNFPVSLKHKYFIHEWVKIILSFSSSHFPILDQNKSDFREFPNFQFYLVYRVNF